MKVENDVNTVEPTVDDSHKSESPPAHIRASMDLGLYVGKALRFLGENLPMIAIGVGLVWLIDHQTSALWSEIQKRPPVAVLNYEKLLEDLGAGSTKEDVERILMTRDAAVKKLADAGYIVLDGNAVLAANDGVVIGGAGQMSAEEAAAQYGSKQTAYDLSEIPVK